VKQIESRILSDPGNTIGTAEKIDQPFHIYLLPLIDALADFIREMFCWL
jgi:hypothetical protein